MSALQVEPDDEFDGLLYVLPDLRTPNQICKAPGCRNTGSPRHRGLCRGRHYRPGPKTPEGRARLKDLKWMLECREWPERAAQRLDPPVKPAALARWLSRHGEYDLAVIYQAIASREKRDSKRVAA